MIATGHPTIEREKMAKKPPKDDKKTKAPKPKAGAPDDIKPTPEQLASAEKSLEQPLIINAQYTKDLSFEAPSAPGIFAELQGKQPDINLNINVSANPVQDKVVEVIFEAHAECKLGDKVVYILELEYAGVFTLNVPDEHLQPIMLIECPRLLFPFARNILADVTRDGGYPPLMLGPLDFAGMYQAKLKELEQEQTAGGGNGGGDGGDGGGGDGGGEKPAAD